MIKSFIVKLGRTSNQYNYSCTHYSVTSLQIGEDRLIGEEESEKFSLSGRGMMKMVRLTYDSDISKFNTGI